MQQMGSSFTRQGESFRRVDLLAESRGMRKHRRDLFHELFIVRAFFEHPFVDHRNADKVKQACHRDGSNEHDILFGRSRQREQTHSPPKCTLTKVIGMTRLPPQASVEDREGIFAISHEGVKLFVRDGLDQDRTDCHSQREQVE